jgi:hypothetical protein
VGTARQQTQHTLTICLVQGFPQNLLVDLNDRVRAKNPLSRVSSCDIPCLSLRHAQDVLGWGFFRAWLFRYLAMDNGKSHTSLL